MSQENVEIVRRAYEAQERRDASAIAALYSPDCVWDMSGMRTEAGIYRGIDGIRAWFREWHDAWDDFRWSCEELIDAGDVVVSVTRATARGRESGVTLDQVSGAGIWTVRDGQIERVVWLRTRAEAFEAVGLSE